MTDAEYLELDRNSEAKNELRGGRIVTVPGGSPRHSLIAANTCIAAGRRLSDGFRVFDSSLRVCLDRDLSYYVYPDLTIVQSPAEYLEDHNETLVNPKVVVEVLSSATLDSDLGSKARMYTRVPSVHDLLMIDQDRVAVEHWVRWARNRWDVVVLEDRDAVVKLESLGCEIPVAEIYAGLEEPGEPNL